MLQFTIKSMLAAVAVAALWLSSFSDYALTSDVRKSMLLFIFLTSGFAAIYNHGKRRAFWAGFFATMLLCGGTSLHQPLHRYTPDFIVPASTPQRSPAVATYFAPPVIVTPQQGYMGGGTIAIPAQSKFDAIVGTTIAAVWTLALAAFVGVAAATIYDQSQQHKDGSPK
jgi:hypothetical protein